MVWAEDTREQAIYMLRSDFQVRRTQCDISRLRRNREYLSVVQFHPSGAIHHRTARVYLPLVDGNGNRELDGQ